jgi:hypothetical protein
MYGCDVRPARHKEMAPTARGSEGQMSARQVNIVYAVEIADAVWVSGKL